MTPRFACVPKPTDTVRVFILNLKRLVGHGPTVDWDPTESIWVRTYQKVLSIRPTGNLNRHRR